MVNPDLIEKFLEGEWSADDIIESVIDEVSCAGAVGSGADRPLNVSYGDYSKVQGLLKQSKKQGEDYESLLDELMPNAPDGTVNGILKGIEDDDE
jgi:hypothetical protein